jgi:hypothetical protein
MIVQDKIEKLKEPVTQTDLVNKINELIDLINKDILDFVD